MRQTLEKYRKFFIDPTRHTALQADPTVRCSEHTLSYHG